METHLMKNLVIMVGPAGSGKSTYSKLHHPDYVYINQDSQGKDHFKLFIQALINGQNIVVDRMSFNKQQRNKYLIEARNAGGYTTKIIVLHESYDTCLERMLKREGHPTVKDETNARAALKTFFTNYERPTPDEADDIQLIYPAGPKPKAIICDLDGTLCNTDHRQHFMNGPNGKKDWRGFFAGMDDDPVNEWCSTLLKSFVYGFNSNKIESKQINVLYCSGRGNEYRERTKNWLQDNHLDFHKHLFMRFEKDSRVDWLIKENILDFEILSRYEVLFALDDRKQVTDMWRRRGIVCLQCAEGNF